MRLQVLHQDEYANEGAWKLPYYLLKAGERQLRVEENEGIMLPLSAKMFTDISSVIKEVLTDIRSKYQNDTWMREPAILATQNIQLW